MSTKQEQQKAAELLKQLVDKDLLPSSLRLPLNKVIDGDEYPGTAQGVIDMAVEILKEGSVK